MSSSSSNGDQSPWDLNILGSACREVLQKHQGHIGDCFVHIEIGEGDYRLKLSDCLATIAIDVHPSADPAEASAEGTTSGTHGEASTTESGSQASATPVVSDSQALLRQTFDGCVDLCVAIADDFLLSCDIPAWVEPCAQWIVRCIMDAVLYENGWPAFPRTGNSIPSRGDLKRLIASSRTTLTPPPITIPPAPRVEQPQRVETGTSTPNPEVHPSRRPPVNKISTLPQAGVYISGLPSYSPTAFSSTSTTSTIGLMPLQVKDNTSTVSADLASKQASTFLGKPVPDELILKINRVGSYAIWRANVCSAINHFECSRQVSAEIILRCIREPQRTRLVKKIPLAAVRDQGHVAIIKALDASNMNRLEMRAIESDWRGLQQHSGETIPAFADRLEDLAHIKETLTGITVTDAEMSERLADGLTDADAIMAKSVVDPSLKLPYEEFKQGMLGFLESIKANGQFSIMCTQGQQHQQRQQPSQGRQLSAAQKSINAKVHSAAAVELGLNSNACIRCGSLGHHASGCNSDSIHRQGDRCGRCGRIVTGDARNSHKCDRSKLQCSRCLKSGHLSGVCRRGLTGNGQHRRPEKNNTGNCNTSNGDVDDESGLHVVETHTAKAMISDASCLSATTRFVQSLPKDPTVELRVGTSKRYCPVIGLVDSGANVSLISASAVAFLQRSNLVDECRLETLPASISIKFGDGRFLSTDKLITLQCFFTDTSLATLQLQFLVVVGCQPSCILGRNLFSDLGFRMVSDHGIPINGLGTISANGQGEVKDDSADHEAGRCARSVAIGGQHYQQCTPLIDVIPDPTSSERRLLQVRFSALENAMVEPFREAPRGRAPADTAIIFRRLEDMAQLGQVQRVQPEDCPIVCEICLVDKLASTDGSQRLLRDPNAPDIHQRFRVTVDCRPVNRLRLVYDSQGCFIYTADPCHKVNEVDKSKLTKQFLTTALLQIQDIPKERTLSFGRLDLQHAFYSLHVTPGLSRLFAVAAKDPSTRKVQHYRFTTLVQGWKYSSLLFGLGTLKIVNEFIQPALDKRHIKVTIICYQDDLLFCGHSDADIIEAMAMAKQILINLNFNTNDKKQEGPVPVIDFCGMRLSSVGVTPSPSRTILTEAAVDNALQVFVKGLPFYPKNKKSKRKLESRQYRTAWLRSWTGVANYMRGWLTPRILAAADILQLALKDFGDPDISSDDSRLTAHIDKVPDAFREVMGYYISGVPCMSLYSETDSNHIATLLISDGNQHAWSGFVLRVVAQARDGHENPLLIGSPSLNELLGTDVPLSVLPMKMFGGRFSKLDSTLSSTTRERMALLLLLEAAKTLLMPPVYSVTDNINCTKEWRSFDHLNYGSWHARYMIFQSYVDGVLWVPRDHPLPSLCDTMARFIEQDEKCRHPIPPPPPHQPHPISLDDTTFRDWQPHLHQDCTLEPTSCNHCTAFAAAADDNDPLLNLPFPSLIHRCFNAWKSGTDFSAHCVIPLDPASARNWLKAVQETDDHCRKLTSLVDRGLSKFHVDQHGLLRLGSKYVLPKKFGRSLALHVHHHYGHCGAKQAVRIICKDFFCLGIASSVQRVIGRCFCRFVRARRGPLQPIISSLRDSITVNDIWFIDTVGPLPTSDKHPYKYILSIMDTASRFVMFLPTTSITSKTITDTIDSQVLTLVGSPRCMVADNSSSFQSVHFRGWAASWGIIMRYVPVYSANRNGALERQHAVLKQVLKAMCMGNTDNWPSFLPYAQKRCNNSMLADGCDYTPQQLYMGSSDASSLGRRFEDISNTITADTVKFDAKRRISRREAMVKEVHHAMEQAEAKIMIKSADRVSRRRAFSVGQKVLKWIDKANGVLQPSWTGPLTIKEVLGTATYRLSDDSVHADRNLCLYHL